MSKETLTENDVLRTAAALMHQKGYHGASMQDLANALGVRKSSLYHHITTKQYMLYAILTEAIESVSKGLFEIADSQLRPSEKLRLAIKNHIIDFVEHLDAVGVLLRERSYLESEYEALYAPKRKLYEKVFQRIIEDGVREGEFDVSDTRLTTFAILGMCNWMVQWYSPQGARSPEDIVDLFTKLAQRMVEKR